MSEAGDDFGAVAVDDPALKVESITLGLDGYVMHWLRDVASAMQEDTGQETTPEAVAAGLILGAYMEDAAK